MNEHGVIKDWIFNQLSAAGICLNVFGTIHMDGETIDRHANFTSLFTLHPAPHHCLAIVPCSTNPLFATLDTTTKTLMNAVSNL